MDDLRVNNDKKTFKNKIILQKILQFIIKRKWWIISFIIISIIIFFPITSGTAIANWINDFLGTIFKIIKL